MGRTDMVTISLRGEDILLDGVPTYPGRFWKGQRVEGQLISMRMVNAIFDDLNPETRAPWIYPDTRTWDPERNVTEFLGMLLAYRRFGVLGVTINLQGGSPEGYCEIQPWINTAFTAYGELRDAYMDRFDRALKRLDELGMIAIVGLFYHLQDLRLVANEMVMRHWSRWAHAPSP
ncbi:MAG: hypothetical protein GY837_14565 [Bosea sp.]|jgi:hypothetical protein|nr:MULTISPECIES: hypothetical protein [Hyphomicrobiales]MCP4561739.1 hypothetical protein [Bosea sp. (in: a-proteobacteria)]